MSICLRKISNNFKKLKSYGRFHLLASDKYGPHSSETTPFIGSPKFQAEESHKKCMPCQMVLGALNFHLHAILHRSHVISKHCQVLKAGRYYSPILNRVSHVVVQKRQILEKNVAFLAHQIEFSAFLPLPTKLILFT